MQRGVPDRIAEGRRSGKGFLFAHRGVFVAKRFEDPVRVYEVSWQDPRDQGTPQ